MSLYRQNQEEGLPVLGDIKAVAIKVAVVSAAKVIKGVRIITKVVIGNVVGPTKETKNHRIVVVTIVVARISITKSNSKFMNFILIIHRRRHSDSDASSDKSL